MRYDNNILPARILIKLPRLPVLPHGTQFIVVIVITNLRTRLLDWKPHILYDIYDVEYFWNFPWESMILLSITICWQICQGIISQIFCQVAKKCRQLTSSKVPKKNKNIKFFLNFKYKFVKWQWAGGNRWDTVCGRGTEALLLSLLSPSLSFRELVIKLLPISFCTFQNFFLRHALSLCVSDTRTFGKIVRFTLKCQVIIHKAALCMSLSLPLCLWVDLFAWRRFEWQLGGA